MMAVLSATTTNKEMDFALARGFHAYYTKPIRKNEFENILQKALSWKERDPDQLTDDSPKVSS